MCAIRSLNILKEAIQVFLKQFYQSKHYLSKKMCLCVWEREKVCVLSRVQLFVTAWTVAHQVPLSIGFPRQEYWSGWPFPPPEDLPDPGIKPTVACIASGSFTTVPPGKPKKMCVPISLYIHIYSLYSIVCVCVCVCVCTQTYIHNTCSFPFIDS